MDKQEKHRLMCELRYWIAHGYTQEPQLTDLRRRIAKKRGKKSADLLIKRIEWYINATANSSVKR